MLSEDLISIIVPIYNVEQYLERCLKSIISQTYSRLEIILVDDGSTDRCPQICDEWALKDDRIKVIHKKNEGLGMARNSGLNEAGGKYICFCDSDDYIAENMVEKVYFQIIRYKADIVCFGFNSVNKEAAITAKRIPCPPKDIYSGDEVQKVFLPYLLSYNPADKSDWNLVMSMCGAMFKVNILKKYGWQCRSEREIISEDVYSLLELYRHVNRVTIVREALYYYCENSTSLTHTYQKDRYTRICHFYQLSLALCKRLNYTQEMEKRLNMTFMSYVIAAIKQIACSDEILTEKLIALRSIINDELLQQIIVKFPKKGESMKRKILFLCIERKKIILCYSLCRLQK